MVDGHSLFSIPADSTDGTVVCVDLVIEGEDPPRLLCTVCHPISPH